KRKLYIPLAFLIVVFTILSIWQAKQYKNGVLTSETVTAEYYFASFFDLYQNPENKKLLAFSHYDVYTQPNYVLPDGYTRTKTIALEIDSTAQNMEGIEFPKGFSIPYRDLCNE